MSITELELEERSVVETETNRAIPLGQVVSSGRRKFLAIYGYDGELMARIEIMVAAKTKSKNPRLYIEPVGQTGHHRIVFTDCITDDFDKVSTIKVESEDSLTQ